MMRFPSDAFAYALVMRFPPDACASALVYNIFVNLHGSDYCFFFVIYKFLLPIM